MFSPATHVPLNRFSPSGASVRPVSDTPLPPPPGEPPTQAPLQPPPPPPGAPAPPSADPAATGDVAAGTPAPRVWKPTAAIAGSALGGAVIAFLISWAAFGSHDGDRQPVSSNRPQTQQGQSGQSGQGQQSLRGQVPSNGAGNSSGSTSQGQGSSAAPSAHSHAS